MPKIVKPLSELECKRAKPKSKDYKLSDGAGMYLLVKISGSKLWRFNYIYNQKQKTISLGIYPETSLQEAREIRETMRKTLKKGYDPSINKKEKIIDTVRDVANAWYNQNKERFSENYQKAILVRIKHIKNAIGNFNINKITNQHIIQMGKDLERQGKLETLHRVLRTLNDIYKYAVSFDIAQNNVVAGVDKKSTFKRPSAKNYPVITKEKELSMLLNAIDNYHGNPITRQALRIMPHVFLRPINIRTAEWSEMDLNEKMWKTPPEKMKTKLPHWTPLSEQVTEILKEVREKTGNGIYVFPSGYASRQMSENTLNQALRRLDYSKEQIVSHSFRGIASTILHENISIHGFHSDMIERQLAHAERNKSKAAYNHAEYIADRAKMMQWWSDYLDNLKNKR
jgi:integrase